MNNPQSIPQKNSTYISYVQAFNKITPTIIKKLRMVLINRKLPN